MIVRCLVSGHKLLVCGNGGSAGDAQHIAGEFISRLMYDRAPLAAVALTTDSSVLTAAANDLGYATVFARQVEALGRKGDAFVAISTSGRSKNVLRALDAAKTRGLVTIGFTRATSTPMHKLCDIVLGAPAEETALIQQLHITAAHAICHLVERELFGSRG